MRKQAQDLTASLANDANKAAVRDRVKAFEANMSAVETKMIDLRNTGRSEDAFRQPVQLYEKIRWMIRPMVGNLGGGSGGGDLGPTAQQVALNAGFKQDLVAIAAQYRAIVDTETPSINALLKQNGLSTTIATEMRVVP